MNEVIYVQVASNEVQILDLVRTVILQHMQAIPEIIAGVLVFLFFLIVSIFVKNIIKGILGASDPVLGSLIGKIVKAVIITVGIITGLGTAGIDITGMVAGLGLGSFALGLALKDAVSNSLHGMLILIYRPFSIGDFIEVKGDSGTVQKIDLRYTELVDEDGTIRLIPNSSLFSNTVLVKRGGTHD